MKNNLYTFLYAAILGVVSASLLAGADKLTGPYKQANVKVERILNILSVLQVPLPPEVSGQELVNTFETNVQEEKSGDLTVYVYAPTEAGNAVEAVAVDFEGPGLWGPIKGFLALEPNMEVIRGITFYEQEETPGLGGEIASAWFTNQFKGKSIIDTEGKPGIGIKHGGGSLAQNEVDAITGATMTCAKLETMLNRVIKKIAEEQRKNGQ